MHPYIVPSKDDDETMVVVFVVTLKAVGNVSRLKYRVLLKWIKLLSVDVAEAKIRDLEDELLELRAEHSSSASEKTIAELEVELKNSKPLLIEAQWDNWQNNRFVHQTTILPSSVIIAHGQQNQASAFGDGIRHDVRYQQLESRERSTFGIERLGAVQILSPGTFATILSTTLGKIYGQRHLSPSPRRSHW